MEVLWHPQVIIEVIATLIPFAIGYTVWLIRLEGKVNYSEKAVAKLEVKHEALDNKIVDKLSVIERSLAKIEGRLSIENEQN